MSDSDYHRQMYVAASKGNPEAVSALLETGMSPNGHDTDGETALHAAVKEDNNEIIETLIQARANPNLVYNDITALERALGQGNETGAIIILRSNKCTPATIEKAKKIAKENSLETFLDELKKSPNKYKPIWKKVDRDRLLHIDYEDCIKTELKEVFNFKARERITIACNVLTGKENIIRESFRIMDEETILNAAEKFRDLGGNVNEHNLLSPIVSKKSVHKTRKIEG